MRLTVPGNLLLLGEYAVTEEGGLGLAVAADQRVVVEMEPASSLIIEGSWGGGKLIWTPESTDQSPLISAVVGTWREQLTAAVEGADAGGRRGRQPAACPAAPPVRITVDSSALFAGGRKSGFGSSAAVTVALSCALLHLSGIKGPELTRMAADLALQAHRRAQGGRGSGYDVYASLHGGFGCLVGGLQPSWQPVELPWLPPLYIFRGRSSVSTPGSLVHYERWKQSKPDEWRRFLEESNRNVGSFLGAGSWARARRILSRARRLGLALGEKIGVSADIESPATLAPDRYKALGAGNELGIYLTETPPREAVVEAVAVAREGVRWYT